MKIDDFKDMVNDFIFDQYSLDPCGYELSEFGEDENGNMTCTLIFPDDRHSYTLVAIERNIYLY